ncbi:MAG: E3 binding domain-containing protein, partial [bacterium]|nr:E3 binding domain-containing protein [bacterium]
MHEPDIAPLARRLAEENNVDWRRLAGSGDAGRVVERDILGYLARVMAGDEAVDPTPEPVPKGMAAWPQDDVAAYRARADHGVAEGSPPTVEDDLFLFDDPVASVPALRAPGPQVGAATPAGERWAADTVSTSLDDDGTLLLVGDETGFDEPELAEPEFEPQSTHHRAADAWDANAVDFSDADDLVSTTSGDRSDRVHAPGGRSNFELPDLFADDAPVEVEREARRGPDLLFEEPASAAQPTVDVGGGPVLEDLTAEVASAAPMASAPQAKAAMLEPEVGAASAPTGGDTAPVEAPLGPVRGFAFVRHGQVWRRRFDDRALRKAVSEVAAELDASVATVTAVLLARAAVRAGAAKGPIEALTWHDGVPQRAPVNVDAALRDVVAGPSAANDDGAGALLVVADLSELDLDEAVLHLEVPLLVLSRTGGDGAWLCLSGDEVSATAIDGL